MNNTALVNNNPNCTNAIPCVNCLSETARLAMEFDKAVKFDYYANNAPGQTVNIVNINPNDRNECVLYKNPEEYTSPIENIYRIMDDLICITANSIYVVKKDVLPS